MIKQLQKQASHVEALRKIFEEILGYNECVSGHDLVATATN